MSALPDIEALERVRAWMVAGGVRRVRTADFEMVLGVMDAPPSRVAAAAPAVVVAAPAVEATQVDGMCLCGHALEPDHTVSDAGCIHGCEESKCLGNA